MKRKIYCFLFFSLIFGVCVAQLSIGNLKLRAWNPNENKLEASQQMKVLHEQHEKKKSQFIHADKFANPNEKGARVASTNPDILANAVVDDGTRIKFNLVSWYLGDFIGIGSIRPVAGTPVECAVKDLAFENAVYANGKLYALKYSAGWGQVLDATYMVYDATTGEELNVIPLEKQWYSIYSIGAYNPADGKIYVLGNDGQRVPYLAVLNPETGTYWDTWSKPCSVNMATMAFDKNGILYTITRNGELSTIDLETCEATVVFRLEPEGDMLHYWNSMAFDPRTGELFWIRTDNEFHTDLRRIDIENKKVEFISDLPDFGTTCTWVESPSAPEMAPNTIEAISTEFDGPSVVGTIFVTAPTTTFNGSALSGDVDVAVAVDGKDAGKMKLAPGETGKITDYNFENPGDHKISVTVSNDAGSSPEGSVTVFCGQDTPYGVSEVKLIVSKDGEATLTWEAPQSGLHNGYIDSDNLTYAIVRNPGMVPVATDITETSFSEQLPTTLASYSYDITVNMNGIKSETVTSNSVVYGDGYGIPFKHAIGDEEFFNLCTVYDPDDCKNGWYESWGSAHCAVVWKEAGEYSEHWLVTPPIHMTPGNYYIKTDYSYQSASPAELKVTFGEGPALEDQTGSVMTADMPIEDYQTYYLEGYIKIEKEGNYNIGFGLCATSIGSVNTPYLSLYNLSIEFGGANEAPAEVTDLKATAFAKGELKASVSFKAPTLNFNNEPITSLDKIEIYNGEDQLLGTIEDVVPGNSYTFIDENAIQGYNTYKVYAYNEAGKGKQAYTETFVGEDIPYTISSLNFNVTDNHIINFEWGAPSEVGANGGYVNPDDLTYNFCRSEYSYVEPFPVVNGRGLTERSYTWEESGNLMGDEQYMIYYGVTPVNKMGTGVLAYTSLVLGKPVSIPFTESFTGGVLNSRVWNIENIIGEDAWKVTTGPTEDNIMPSDQDGGMVYFRTLTDQQTQQALVTPLFALKDMKDPVLVFDMYHQKDASPSSVLSVQISSNDSKYKPLEDYIYVKADRSDWARHTISLKDYNGDDRLFIAFIGASFDHPTSFAIDNIRICDNIQYDLEIEAFNAPSNLMLNDEGEFEVKVKSNGINPVSDYSVDFYADGIKVGSVPGLSLTVGKTATLSATIATTAPNANKIVEYEARVNLQDDSNDENNSAFALVEVGGSKLPAPLDLTASSSNDEMELNWTKPGEPVAEKVTDSFEDYESFAITGRGPWKFVDGDNLYPYGINGVEYPNMEQPRAFMFWNPQSIGFTDTAWQPRTGQQCLIAFASSYMKVEGGTDFYQLSDEWLISENVIGGTEVSFYANIPYTLNNIERFEFMVSSTGKSPEDFTRLGDVVQTSTAGWNKYSYTLPEDAKYFAIHYISYGYQAFALMIDDIEYTPGYGSVNLKGYNVYVNGILDAESPVAINQAKVKFDANLDNEFGVSALYEEGESEMTVLNIASGVESVESTDIIVRGEHESIAIYNASGRNVKIMDIAGHIFHDFKGTDYDVISSISKGIYIVTVGNETFKVMVK